MDTLTEAIVASFDSNPDVEWHQLFSSEPAATFWVEGDIVQVQFRQAGESTWNISVMVGSTKSSAQIVANSIRIWSGVFCVISEFREAGPPRKFTFAPGTNRSASSTLGGLSNKAAKQARRTVGGFSCP